MKLLLYLLFSLINSIAFLLYLSTINSFVPVAETGSYNWTNIVTVVVLFFIAVFSFLGILITLGQLPFRKSINNVSWYTSIKYSGIVSVFLLALGILYFFHILTWYWILAIFASLGILIVVI
jgi:hypothetical protein